MRSYACLLVLALLNTVGCGERGTSPQDNSDASLSRNPEAQLGIASPVGVWTVRHELKQGGPEETGESVVTGFSTSRITLSSDGTFDEILTIDLFRGTDPDPMEYRGTWQQNAEIVRFRREESDATHSYVIDRQGLRMSGNVAGHEVVLTRELVKEKPE